RCCSARSCSCASITTHYGLTRPVRTLSRGGSRTCATTRRCRWWRARWASTRGRESDGATVPRLVPRLVPGDVPGVGIVVAHAVELRGGQHGEGFELQIAFELPAHAFAEGIRRNVSEPGRVGRRNRFPALREQITVRCAVYVEQSHCRLPPQLRSMRSEGQRYALRVAHA